MKKILYILLFITSILTAQLYKGGGGPNAFLQNLQDARDVSLSGSDICDAGGILSQFSNPGNIFYLDENYSDLTYFAGSFNISPSIIQGGINKELSVVDDMYDGNFALSFYWKTYTIGIYYLRRSVDNLWHTSVENDEVLLHNTFKYAENYILLNFAGHIIRRLSLGINVIVKSVESREYSLTQLSGVDIGARYHWHDRISLGLVISLQNDGRNSLYATKFGLNSSLYNTRRWNVNLSGSFESGNYNIPTTAIGIEAEFISGEIIGVNTSIVGRTGGNYIIDNSTAEKDNYFTLSAGFGLATSFDHFYLKIDFGTRYYNTEDYNYADYIVSKDKANISFYYRF